MGCEENGKESRGRPKVGEEKEKRTESRLSSAGSKMSRNGSAGRTKDSNDNRRLGNGNETPRAAKSHKGIQSATADEMNSKGARKSVQVARRPLHIEEETFNSLRSSMAQESKGQPCK